VSSKNITDDGISMLFNLRELYCFNSALTNRGVSCLTNLQVLNLFNDEKITDDGIICLSVLTRLSVNKKNSNSGIAHLKNLRFLTLSMAGPLLSPDVIDHLPLLETIAHVPSSRKEKWSEKALPRYIMMK